MERFFEQDINLHVLFINLKKSFDRINHKKLTKKLLDMLSPTSLKVL